MTTTMQFKTTEDERHIQRLRDFILRGLPEEKQPRRKATADDIQHVIDLLGCRQVLRRLWLDAEQEDTDYARDFARRVKESGARALHLLAAVCKSTIMDDEELLGIANEQLDDAERHFSAGEDI